MSHKSYTCKYPESKDKNKINALFEIVIMAAEVCCNQREDVSWDDIMHILEKNKLNEYWRSALEYCEEN